MVVICDAKNMVMALDGFVHLVVTSPPYFSASFDYPNLFPSYGAYLETMRRAAREVFRALTNGRVACIVCGDALVVGERYSVAADLTSIFVFVDAGFRYRDRIVWLKPESCIRVSRRSGVLLQRPYSPLQGIGGERHGFQSSW